ncbi:basic proline-rich protein [Gracilaria domingensis]|nr:basic proline-rich protein [Gracilaria domingensis]
MRAAAGVAVRAGSGEGRKRDEAGDDGGEERGAVHERQQWACGGARARQERWGVRGVAVAERGEAADGDAQERGQDAGDEGEPRVAAGAGLDLLQRGDEDVCNGGGHWRRAEAQDRRGRRGRGRQRGDGAAEVVRARGGAGAVWAGSGGADGGAAAGVHGEEAACGSGRAAAGARGGAARGAGGAQGVRRRAERLGGGAGDRRDAHCARARARARGRARGRARERRVGAGGETARRRDGGAAELHAVEGRGAAARRARRGGVHGAAGAAMQAAAAGVQRRRRRRTPTCASLTRAAPCGRSRGARALGRARAARAATAAAGGRRRAGGGGAARGRARAQRARF